MRGTTTSTPSAAACTASSRACPRWVVSATARVRSLDSARTRTSRTFAVVVVAAGLVTRRARTRARVASAPRNLAGVPAPRDAAAADPGDPRDDGTPRRRADRLLGGAAQEPAPRPPRDPAALAAAMASLIGQPEARRELGRSGRRRAETALRQDSYHARVTRALFEEFRLTPPSGRPA